MPNDQHEPLAAILSEMRKAVVPMICGRPKIEAVSIRDVLQWADRIEAAAEREREINQKILAAANDANAILKDDRDRAIQFANAAPHPGSVSWKEMHEVYAKARAIPSAVPKEGSAAAMREALVEILDRTNREKARDYDAALNGGILEIHDIANTALSQIKGE